MMTSICIYMLVIFVCTKNKSKTKPGLEISFQIKLRECFSDFLGLTKFLRLEKTVDWSELLKFERTCSNLQGTIGMNTKIGESTIFKSKTD